LKGGSITALRPAGNRNPLPARRGEGCGKGSGIRYRFLLNGKSDKLHLIQDYKLASEREFGLPKKRLLSVTNFGPPDPVRVPAAVVPAAADLTEYGRRQYAAA
jgi:hypothetical protein